MTPERWQYLKQLYEEAAALPPDQRQAFLTEVGAADGELRRELELMLAAEEDSAFMKTPAPEQEARAAALLARGALLGRRLGHYQVLELLGAGAMGDVYLAQDLQLERRVALKVLPAEFTREPERLQRFIREAKAASALNHPNIITIHEIGAERPDGLDGPDGDDGDDIHFIAAEFIEGVTLRQRLAEGALPVRAALDVALQITAALAATHQAGIIHRDIKPENVMVRPDGLVKVLDFGLAKLTEARGADALGSTGHGVVLGTPRYMSPEQARGQDVGAGADIFSCGALLYELLTGQPAFQRETMAETMAAILKEEPAELSETNPQVSPQLARIVRHCLEKKPEMRFQSARDLGFALEALSTPSGARPAPQPGTLLDTAAALPAVMEKVGQARTFGNARLAQLAPLEWMVAAALLVGLIGLLGFALAYFRRAPSESPATYTYLPLPEKTTSAVNHGSALSPDGRRVVLVAVTGEVTRLWLYSFDTPEPELLPGTEEAHYPFWSPQGQSIGFFAQGQLKRIEASGGMPTTLCAVAGTSGGIGGAWSSTGVILFAPQFNGAGLYQVSAAGGTATPVTSLDATRFETGHNFPSFLPDGRHFIFFTQAGQPDYRGIRLGSLDQPRTSFLLRADTKAEYSSAGYLLLMRGRKFLAQRFDPAKLVLSGDPVPVTEQVHYEPPYRYADLSVVSDRVLLYRGGGNLNTQLFWFDRGGRQLAAVGPAGEYHSVQLSPDGGRALLDRNDPQVETSDIWQFDLLRNTHTRLTSNPAPDTYPIWSPEGSRIAFVSNREGFWGIYQKALSGDDKEELLLKGDQQLLLTSDWSPDGKFIVYRKYQNTGIDLELLPLSGDRQPRSYLATPFDESYGKVSPDGRWLAYQSDNSGRMEINVQSFPEPGRRVTISQGGGILPRWRSDGKELYYVAADDKLMAVPVKTGTSFRAGTPVALFELGSFGRIIGRYVYDVSRDGQKFLVIRPLEDASMRPLTVVQNWTELLKK